MQIDFDPQGNAPQPPKTLPPKQKNITTKNSPIKKNKLQ